jgi:two-component sensor histidine kinase
MLPLEPDVLPTFTVVIAICFATVLGGFWAGATTMVIGGALTWQFILPPDSWVLSGRNGLVLLGYFAVAAVILGTAGMYRRSELQRNRAQIAHAEKEAASHKLFAGEMAHRLKNSLAIVQATALQTFRADTPELPKFEGRLSALARANNLLSEHVEQPTARVREVVETAIEPFRSGRDAFRLAGPDIALPGQDAVALTLALHELATNAVKYGALAEPKGSVAVTWEETAGKLVLTWKEHDGPPVKRPTTFGFGSRLLRRAAMGADLHFESDGVRCTIRQR